MGHHAIVFGASGILGWAVVNEILHNYPEKGAYSKVTALTNRPLTLDDALWPHPSPDIPELSLVSGIDLSKGTVDEWREILKQKVPDIETVDHVYYHAYCADPAHFRKESDVNVNMLKRAIGALEALAPNMSYVILPTGTKAYGVAMPNRPFKAPFFESMGELPNPERDDLFYYVLRDELTTMQKGKRWRWAECRCDIVAGFVPNSNSHNLFAYYMGFLSLYEFMHEHGHPDAASTRVPFPSPEHFYPLLNNEGGQDVLARFSIYLCLHPERAGNGELYNIADESQPRSYGDRWPYFASLFGFEGVGPVPSDHAQNTAPVKFIREHRDWADRLEREKGIKLQGNKEDELVETWLVTLDFDHHHMLLDKARSVGFTEEQSYQETWKRCLERYLRAKMAYVGESTALGALSPTNDTSNGANGAKLGASGRNGAFTDVRA